MNYSFKSITLNFFMPPVELLRHKGLSLSVYMSINWFSFSNYIVCLNQMFWNLNILVITTEHISRLVVSCSLFLSKVPFYMEKFVHLLFPHSNFTLTQPNVMKLYQNITVLIGIASLSPFLSYPFFVCY